MTTPPPSWLTRADMPGVAAAASNVAGEAAGGSFGFSDLESLFKAAQRFEGGMQRFIDMVGQLRGMEQQDQGVDFEPTEAPRMTAAKLATGSTGATVGQITGEKVYAVLLKSLRDVAEAMPDLTMAEALVEARARKDFIISSIDAELIKMASPAE